MGEDIQMDSADFRPVISKAAEVRHFLSGPRRLPATARSAVKLLVRANASRDCLAPSYICGVVVDESD